MSRRVMRVITRLNVGGPARQALLLTTALRDRGYRADLVVGSEGEREGTLRPPGLPLTIVPTLRREVDLRADLRAARALLRLVRAGRPHIVHTHLAKAGALARLAARRARVPVVVHTFHGHVLDGYFSPTATRAFLAAERRLADWTDVLVGVSAAVRDELLALRIGRPDQWRVIPLGLDLGPLIGLPPDPTEARRRLRLPAAGPVVGIVGRLVGVKDHATFLDAAARVAAARPEVSFAVAGDGPLRLTLEDRARVLLGDRVRFTGWVHDLPALYSALDVVALTSRNEGTPVALIEAGAAERPVVATRVGGVADVVRDGDTGLLAPAGDPAALAGEILALLDQPERARAMGRAGRAWVRDRFGAERLVADIVDLYAELMDRRGLGVGRGP